MTTPTKLKWASVTIIASILAVAGREMPLLSWLTELAESIRLLGTGGVVLYALCYATAAMLCVPCMPLTIAGGFIFGAEPGLVAVHVGTALAAAGGFLTGRWAARGHIADWLRCSNRFRFLDDAIAKEGWKIVGLLRTLPIALGPSNYLYGMTGLRFWPYLLATVLAMLPANIVFVYLGSTGKKSFDGKGGVQPLEWIAFGLGIASLITLGVFTCKLLRKHGHLTPLERADGQ